MIRDQWRDVDITAYLDEQLASDRLRAFENAIAQNNALRQRVEAMRKTRALLRETPLREVPRNYILSPSMVADTKPAQKSRPRSIGFMRLATSLTAAAFVLTMGLTVLNRGIAPSVVSEPRESLQLMQDEAALKLDTGREMIPEAEEPVFKIATDTPTLDVEVTQENAFALEEPSAEVESEAPTAERVVAETPESDAEAEGPIGMGGGSEKPEEPIVEAEVKAAAEAADEADVAPIAEGEGEQPANLEMAESPLAPEEESGFGTAEGEASEPPILGEDAEGVKELEYAADEIEDSQPPEDTIEGEVITAAPPTELSEEMPVEPEWGGTPSQSVFWRLSRTRLPRWVPLSLGITTLILLGITLLISSRRR